MKHEELERKAEEEISALITKKIAELRKKQAKRFLRSNLSRMRPCLVLRGISKNKAYVK
jgi:hypothetical protein